MKIIVALIQALGLLFLSSISAFVNGQQLTILTEHLAPFQIVKDSKITGITTEIVEKTLRTAKYDYKIEALPWATAFNLAKREKNTCIYSLTRIPTREPLFNWVGHIVNTETSLYSLASKEFSISSIDDAKKYKIAVIREDVTHHFLLSKGFIEGDNLYVMDNYDALLELLETPSRSIDFILINDDLIFHRVKSTKAASKYKNVYFVKELTLDFYLACSLNTDQNIVEKLQQTMKKLEEDGIFNDIRKKYSLLIPDLF